MNKEIVVVECGIKLGRFYCCLGAGHTGKHSYIPLMPKVEPPREEITDRDLNLLESCANWLETRSSAHIFRGNGALMREYATKLADIRRRLVPIAVEKPVTLDEVFGKSL